MIELRPFEDLAALAVIRQLDPMDYLEAELTRGAITSFAGLFADWRAMQPHRAASLVAHHRARPFALFALTNTGMAGVAAAALLARDHMIFRRPLAELALILRRNMPAFAAERGIHRIEARAWADHPQASGLLSALGFAHECDMPGFGPGGTVTFRQFAWTAAHTRTAPETCPGTNPPFISTRT